jgi:hypothetical protein
MARNVDNEALVRKRTMRGEAANANYEQELALHAEAQAAL